MNAVAASREPRRGRGFPRDTWGAVAGRPPNEAGTAEPISRTFHINFFFISLPNPAAPAAPIHVSIASCALTCAAGPETAYEKTHLREFCIYPHDFNARKREKEKPKRRALGLPTVTGAGRHADGAGHAVHVPQLPHRVENTLLCVVGPGGTPVARSAHMPAPPLPRHALSARRSRSGASPFAVAFLALALSAAPCPLACVDAGAAMSADPSAGAIDDDGDAGFTVALPALDGSWTPTAMGPDASVAADPTPAGPTAP